MADQIQKWKEDLALVEACIPGCRDKVWRANAELASAKKHGNKELIAFCKQEVEDAKLRLEENVSKRDELTENLKR
jgi:hypothetical protein